MKNIICLQRELDTMDFLGSLWRSDAFRESMDSGGFIYEQAKRFSWLPRFFAEATNDHLERAHFSTWWNVIIMREYDNPIIHDLYYLHEMRHAATMPYIRDIGRKAFDEKMQRNELEASVLSEIAVYFAMPGLRETSFDHPIYADRFLNDPSMRRLWNTNRQVTLEMLRSMRRDVMVSKSRQNMDLTEIWIRKFAEQNAVYSAVWADTYKEVEGHMADFQDIVAEGHRADATAMHYKWLVKQMGKDPIDNIPFRLQAELFSPFYWAEKAKYDEAMKKKEAVAA